MCADFSKCREQLAERPPLLYGAKKYIWCAVCVRLLLAVQRGVRIRPNANCCAVVGEMPNKFQARCIIGLPL